MSANNPMDTITELAMGEVFVCRCLQAISDRSENDWIDICDYVIKDNKDTQIIGILNHLIKNDLASFRWAMFQISIRRGYEDLVARFFIGTYQMEMAKKQ